MDLLPIAAALVGLVGVVLLADWLWSRRQKRRLDATGRVGGSATDPATKDALYEAMRDTGSAGTQ